MKDKPKITYDTGAMMLMLSCVADDLRDAQKATRKKKLKAGLEATEVCVRAAMVILETT